MPHWNNRPWPHNLKQAASGIAGAVQTAGPIAPNTSPAPSSKPVAGTLAFAPARPRTNGKAERFIQTPLREWACARPYTTSAIRNQTVGQWTDA